MAQTNCTNPNSDANEGNVRRSGRNTKSRQLQVPEAHQQKKTTASKKKDLTIVEPPHDSTLPKDPPLSIRQEALETLLKFASHSVVATDEVPASPPPQRKDPPEWLLENRKVLDTPTNKNDDAVDHVTKNLSPIHHATPPTLDADVRADMMRYASIAAVDVGPSASSELDDSDALPVDDDSKDKDYIPPRQMSDMFNYSDDDDDYLFDDDELNDDSKRIEESDLRKKVPVGRRKGNLLLGGPEEPNYDGMTVSEADIARNKYLVERKKWRQLNINEKLKLSKGTEFQVSDYTGNLSPTLRTMQEVSGFHLQAGHTFPDRDIILLRVAEEANYG